MNSSNILMFGILIFLMTVISVQSLKCYVCSSCNEPFDKKDSDVSIESCAGSCLKGDYGGVVARACSDYNLGDVCADVSGTHSCSCTSDLCNSASGVSVSFPVVCISAIILFLRVF
ncbi:uncharacterized protein LOC132743809 [Ruditapes philippinarum]|uniref:uncharacterized protein LOC132743809 n=1 Tax=Ruditapes philippinarum TaxID=129788 RepID=UPI00295A65A0|nr:uncharacterized protein LOC132743809 [Ruditapes philippinarum]